MSYATRENIQAPAFFTPANGIRLMKSHFLILSMGLFLVGCAGARARQNIREGMLVMELPQKSFLDVWGKPDRTAVTSGDDMISANWGTSGGGFFKGKRALEVWDYESRKTSLVFSNRKLIAWKTKSTVKELETKEN